MAMNTGIAFALFLCVLVVDCGTPPKTVNAPFSKSYVVTWGQRHAKLLNGGSSLELLLDKVSGAGFESKASYLFGHFSMRIKLVPGDSAGVVTAFYLSSQNSEHDEIDFEFLGNRSGQPYILQTNVFVAGNGSKEQRSYLWFDPSKEYHSYSVLWNLRQIVFFVDSVPLRIFKNVRGLKYPFFQPMKLYSSLWNADDWATRGGLEKTDWSKAPFVSTYTLFHVDGCDASSPILKKRCATVGERWWDQPVFQDLNRREYLTMKYFQNKYRIYNYCVDKTRNRTPPIECAKNKDILIQEV